MAMNLFFLAKIAMDEHRFAQKKIDESWKESVAKEKEVKQPQQPSSATKSAAGKDSPAFANFLTSLIMQGLMHLGEIENPATGTKSEDLEAAKEIIDLLLLLKQKTVGKLSSNETKIFESLLPDLQMKFVQKAG